MVSLFLLLRCNLRYIVDLFAALHELTSARARTLLKLASSVRALLKPYGDTLNPDRLLASVRFLSGLFPKKDPKYLRECLPYNTELNLGISKFWLKLYLQDLVLKTSQIRKYEKKYNQQ